MEDKKRLENRLKIGLKNQNRRLFNLNEFNSTYEIALYVHRLLPRLDWGVCRCAGSWR